MKSGSSDFYKKPVFIVLLLLLVLLIVLLFSGLLSMIHYSKPISQARAVDICPFLLITEEEYDLLRQIRQDEDIISTSTGEFDGEWVVINANRSEGQIL